MYLFGGFLILFDLLTGGPISGSLLCNETGFGVGLLASGISGDCTGLLGGVTYDGDAGDSITSSNCGVGL